MTVSNRLPAIILLAAVVGVTAWAYWTTLADIADRWVSDPQYSHGFLVPVFAGYLLWRRRADLRAAELRPQWWGLMAVLVGGGLRVASHFLYQPWLDASSLLVVLAGLAAAAGGRRLLVLVAPAVLFLGFMIPLPYRVQTLLGGTLQSIATAASTYALQTVGVPAVSEGNVILLTDTQLGVVEACSGLAMMVTFFALATGVAILARRHWAVKGVLVLGAVPIAVAANVARITATGVLAEASQDDLARAVFHDLAGWLMMPFGLLLLLAGLYVMDRCVRPAGGRPAVARVTPASRTRAASRQAAAVGV
jgi:exosortase